MKSTTTNSPAAVSLNIRSEIATCASNARATTDPVKIDRNALAPPDAQHEDLVVGFLAHTGLTL